MTVKDECRTIYTKATIKDVAKDAGVSVAAVSKVLRNAYGVSEEMRQKVNSSVERLNYRPRTAARSMRGKSYTVGVAMPELSSPFPPQIADEIDRFFKQTPYRVIVTICGTDNDEGVRSIESLIDRQIDGIILISPWLDADWLEQLGQQIPMVLMARNGVGQHFDTVTDNSFEGAMAMVDYLVTLGHRNIAYTSMPDGGFSPPFTLSHTTRQSGYESAMLMHGLTPRVVVTTYSEQGGYDAAAQLLDSDNPPTAIFAGSDIAAFGVMRAAYDRHLDIPYDLTVTGYDNVFASGLHGIDLTTINEADSGMGTKAAQMLLSRMNGRTDPVCQIESPSLIIRRTSAPPKTPKRNNS
ncbi:LacI family DNA-binding transcriptional regulator [Bifidobacterium sp. SO4]|uniref:LacI family DNA-binding transcriptional regulator n=1 Tax=Bifidobacterium sp. SO4 TaxID=2809030 RepID=UPI001BDDC4B5|nr:LacI family DNA-binding transcriptional regulator [Bifidobacterium sp. SO4]MBT1170613.1 LacI family DNA-binding transcriptional regulator [Bifidobacterium sp. SO4]